MAQVRVKLTGALNWRGVQRGTPAAAGFLSDDDGPTRAAIARGDLALVTAPPAPPSTDASPPAKGAG